MAGGWARDGAVNEQIEASVEDELKRMKLQGQRAGVSRSHCEDCDEPIPAARRHAIPGVRLCVDCQQEREGAQVQRGGINRRGSKDSQLK